MFLLKNNEHILKPGISKNNHIQYNTYDKSNHRLVHTSLIKLCLDPIEMDYVVSELC